MTQTPEEIFQAMNASRILVAILTKLGTVEIPTELFMAANNEDKQLSVTYNDETLAFEFKLREDGDEEQYELIND
ncbi:MAG: hypothetical protein O3A64_04055 [Proteobacteria bacterium]|nr:hypothetical protein [Pseudomonadota bacterium]